MLFLKRLSDEFDRKREQLRKKDFAHLKDQPDLINELLEDKTSYGETFFVPVRARWHEPWIDPNGDPVPALKDLKHDIGNMLNKAIAAVEEENDALAGVLKNNIDFNAVKGKTKIPEQKWKDLLDHFNQPQFVLVNDNFEFPDLLSAAYEYLIKFFADSAGKKGGEFYTPAEVVRLLVQLTKPEAGNTVYDPTVGSGGFLIQSHQYVEEQGQDPNDLALYGQDSNGTVWSICNMNMILHNITRFTIENGDTLEDPLILENGQVRKFDRVLANPPFSQNYSRSTLKFPSRFREWCPETGIFINDNVIEAIISLPPGLFYGTGIPACVIVANKSKPEAQKDKVLFINADREYAEGKAQNKLRPEDIEKIDFVFTQKLEIPKYSRLVDKAEILETHDYNLNIRRYVDNTPEPEPEDVQAHLIGGIPEAEVQAKQADFAKFGIDPAIIFQEDRPGYHAFRLPHPGTSSSGTAEHQLGNSGKAAIKPTLEADPNVQKTLTLHYETLEDWWAVARHDFSGLHNGKKMPEVRHELLTTIKAKLIPLGILDEFKSAGVFVNWWQQIRYDLKTIIATGWHHSLIPDDYLVAAFFQAEAAEIESIEDRISEAQSELAEAVETAQEVAAYEPEEDESVTAAVIKKALKDLIDDLKDSTGDSARKELENLQAQEKAIAGIEKRLKDSRAALKTKTNELELKLQLKRLGGDEFKAENHDLIRQVDAQLANLGSSNKDDKKKNTALNKDKAALQARLARTDAILAAIGGQLTEEGARRLILKKLYDLARNELNRYLNTEKRGLIVGVEKLWGKYAVSSRELEKERAETLKTLDGFLTGLGYLGNEP
jgi:type I restriction enzyme M protein